MQIARNVCHFYESHDSFIWFGVDTRSIDGVMADCHDLFDLANRCCYVVLGREIRIFEIKPGP